MDCGRKIYGNTTQETEAAEERLSGLSSIRRFAPVHSPRQQVTGLAVRRLPRAGATSVSVHVVSVSKTLSTTFDSLEAGPGRMLSSSGRRTRALDMEGGVRQACGIVPTAVRVRRGVLLLLPVLLSTLQLQDISRLRTYR